jgi:hypothetical protein
MPRPGREAPDKIAAAAWGPARQCNQRNAHGGGEPDPIGWRGLGRTKMTDWKAHMDMLVEGTIALTKSISVQSPPPPPTCVEPAPMPSVNLRDELRERVSNFKAHQERFTGEREDYAASQIKRMMGRSGDRNRPH